MGWLRSFFIGTASFCLLLHVFSVVVLKTSKQIKRTNFNSLICTLSIADIAFVTSGLVKLCIGYGKDLPSQYGCIVMKRFTLGATLFAKLVLLLTCFELINCTFVPRRKILQRLTSIKGTVCLFVCVLLHTAILTGYAFDNMTVDECKEGPNEQTVVTDGIWGITEIMCIVLILAVYIAILVRIRRQHRTITHQQINKTNYIVQTTEGSTNTISEGTHITGNDVKRTSVCTNNKTIAIFSVKLQNSTETGNHSSNAPKRQNHSTLCLSAIETTENDDDKSDHMLRGLATVHKNVNDRKSKKTTRQRNSFSQHRQRRREITLGIIIGTVLVSAFPVSVLGIYGLYPGHSESTIGLFHLSGIFLFLESFLHLFVYIFRVPGFKETIINMFRQICCRFN